MIKQKKLILRTCIASRCILPKENLIRVVVTKHKLIFIDFDYIIFGRGAYFVLTLKNVLLIQKKKILEKKLKTYIPQEIYQKLLEIVKTIEN
ncbi:YlxR family protein [Candidatus Phytoplasma prunorum]|uniref:YlxR family protein n=1 Tax=Candidatus Phytoplasma prunorum TaxID=47565 RepID=UPI002FF214BD